jgi:hypothetical protein
VFEVDDDLLKKYKASIDLSNFPREFVRQFNLTHPDSQELWYRERFKCLKYHVYLSGYAEATKAGDEDKPINYVPILGMDFQPDPHNILFSRFVQKRPGENKVFLDLELLAKKMMILWPRGLFKTSAVIVDIVQTILNYPNIRICFLTGGDQLAKRQLERVKRVFEKPSPRFKWLFPEFCLKDVRNRKVKNDDSEAAWTSELCKMGTQHEFTVPCRTNLTFAEPTFAISTAKSVKAGSHYDIIYIDDLVNEQNYRSIPMLEKCYDDYIAICPLLEPSGYIVMTGTRYSFGDTYERIQELAHDEDKREGRSIWRFSIRDCWSHGCQNCVHTSVYHDFEKNIIEPPCIMPGCACPGFKDRGDKGVLFPLTRSVDGRPIGHTVEMLEAKRREYGQEFFANQYENCPIAAGTQTFDENMIGAQTFHNLNQMPSDPSGFTFAVGDLAYVGQPDRDYSVIYICRAIQGRIWVYDCLFGNWDSGQVADVTVDEVLLKFRPNIVYYEKVNGWDGFDKLIAAAAATRGMPKVPLQWEKGSQAKNAKMRRIGDIKGWITSRRLWIYGGMRGYDKLVAQLTHWPKHGRHDDFADCMGMVVAAPTGVQLSAPPPADDSGNWLRKLHDMNPTGPGSDAYPDNGCGSGVTC